MKKKVIEGHIPRCENAKCKGTGTMKQNGNQKQEKERGLVKPDIVFFGEGVSYTSRCFSHCVEAPLFLKLPDEFHQAIPTLQEADLLIVMGTSLTVHPFAMLAELVPKGCPRSVCSTIIRDSY